MGVPGIDPTELVGHLCQTGRLECADRATPMYCWWIPATITRSRSGTFRGAVDPLHHHVPRIPRVCQSPILIPKKSLASRCSAPAGYAAKRLRPTCCNRVSRGLPSAGRDTEISGECAREKKACGRASASCSTSASRSGKAWRRGITNCATAARADQCGTKSLAQISGGRFLPEVF